MKAYIVDTDGNVWSGSFQKDSKTMIQNNDRREKGGRRGHRPGTMMEKLHEIFDKHGVENLDKAKAEAAKKTKASPATINTSFSRFRAQA